MLSSVAADLNGAPRATFSNAHKLGPCDNTWRMDAGEGSWRIAAAEGTTPLLWLDWSTANLLSSSLQPASKSSCNTAHFNGQHLCCTLQALAPLFSHASKTPGAARNSRWPNAGVSILESFLLAVGAGDELGMCEVLTWPVCFIRGGWCSLGKSGWMDGPVCT